MDVLVGLPRTRANFDVVWVIVDRLIKSAYFFTIRNNFSLDNLAKIYTSEIVKLHGVSISIVSDRDPRFTSRFWPKFQKTLGTTFHFSIAFHPQINGHSERTI